MYEPELSTHSEEIPSLYPLNTYLDSRDISPVRYTLKTPWQNASARTKRQYVRKAKQAISAALTDIAPEQQDQLWQEVLRKPIFPTSSEDEGDLGSTDSVLMEALASCYNNASSKSTKRQILSYMADKLTFKQIQKYIPGLTRYYFTVARKHILEHGRGVVVQRRQSRMAVPEEKLSHFLDFITSPHIVQDLPFGSKTITLSSKEVITVPNIIRSMIPERIVSQYQTYAAESNFVPMSRSSLLRILDVCSASTRKSLQGLDYITAAGTEAFDSLENVLDRVEKLMTNIRTSDVKQLKESLKVTKRYLKNDYKVGQIN